MTIRAEPFVGRAAELDDTWRWVEEVATTGIGRLVALVGEPGVGASRLCGEIYRTLAAKQVATVWVRCWSGCGALPLAPWPDVLAELDDGSSASLDVEDLDRSFVFREVVARLRARCEREVVVVLLDDLDAAGAEAHLLTRFVIRSLHHMRLLLVVTAHAGAGGVGSDDDVAVTLREAQLVRLGPFGRAEIAEYLTSCRSPALVDEVLAITGGHPLWVAQLARAPAPPMDHLPGPHHVLADRVAALAGPTYRVHVAAAALGTGATVAEVAELCGVDTVSVHAQFERGSLGTVVTDGRPVFAHDLVREALVASLPSNERMELILGAVAVVHGDGVEPVVRRAELWLAVAALSGRHQLDATTACRDAARALMSVSAYDEARAWARRAQPLAIHSVPPGELAHLLLMEADAALAAGRLKEARACYEQAVDPARRADDPAAVGRAALGMGGIWVEEQRDEISRRRMLALCRSTAMRVRADDAVLADLIEVRVAAEEVYEGAITCDELAARVDAVRSHGVPRATAEALSLYHHALLSPARSADRLEVADELLDVAAAAHAGVYALLGLCWRTVDLYLLGDQRAEASFHDLEQQTRAVESRSIAYIEAVLDVMRTLRRGDLSGAEWDPLESTCRHASLSIL